MRNAWLYLLVFIWLWAPIPNVPYGPYLDPQFWIPVFCIVLNLNKTLNLVTRKSMPILVLFVLSIFLALFSCFVNGEPDYLSVLRLAKGVVMFLGAAAFVVWYDKKYSGNYTSLIWAVYLGIGANGVIMLLQMIFPQFRALMEQYLYIGFSEAGGLATSIRMYRVPGLTQTGGAFVSLLQGIGYMMALFVLRGNRSKKNFILVVLISIINIFAMLFSGRTGVYISGMLSLVIFYLAWKSGKGRGFLNFWLYMIKCNLIACGIAFIFGLLLSFALGADEKVQSAVNRNMDLVFDEDESFVANATARAYVTDLLVFPSTAREWLIGDPGEISLSRGFTTDMGYCRMLMGYGLFGTVFQVAIYVIPIVILLKKRKILPPIGWVTIFLFVMGLAYNYKELSFFTRIIWPLLSMMLFASIMNIERILNETRNIVTYEQKL